jgi:hypothetical protein
MQQRKLACVPCESCGVRSRELGGQLNRCGECLKRLVERDRRLRAERAAFRGDKLIREKLATAKSGAESPQANGGGLKNNQRKSNDVRARQP